MINFVIMLIIGIVAIGMGVYMFASGDATLLHSYHRANVLPQNMPVLAHWSGLGAVMIGAGVILLSLPFLAKVRPLPRWARGMLPTVLAGVLLVGGIAVTMLAIIYFNGAIYS